LKLIIIFNLQTCRVDHNQVSSFVCNLEPNSLSIYLAEKHHILCTMSNVANATVVQLPNLYTPLAFLPPTAGRKLALDIFASIGSSAVSIDVHWSPH